MDFVTIAIVTAFPAIIVILALLGVKRDTNREEALASGTLGVALADYAETTASEAGGESGSADGAA